MYMDGCIHIEKTDQCYDCEFFARGVMCPLLEALAVGVVELKDEMTVENCGFYKKFSRHLSVVETEEEETEAATDEEGDEDDRLSSAK